MNTKAVRKDIKLEKGPQYYNPLVRLIWDTNETDIVVDGVSCKGLVDSRAQISTITKSFTKALGFKKYSLDGLLDRVGRRNKNGMLKSICRIWRLGQTTEMF